MPHQQSSSDPALVWDQPGPAQRPRNRPPDSRPEEAPAEVPAVVSPSSGAPVRRRTTLTEASDRFGVSVGTLRRWARDGRVDAIKDTATTPHRWMVDPDSVAAMAAQRAVAPRAKSVPTGQRATGPTEDGSAMLVPRDAWDRLMDQLGNLHEAGRALGDARERAAKAETEALFLRGRLAELRAERDRLIDQSGTEQHAAQPEPQPTPQHAAGSRGVFEGRMAEWARRARDRVRPPRGG